MAHSLLRLTVSVASIASVFVLGGLSVACGGSGSGNSTNGSSSDDSCGCDIDVNGDEQSLSCGQSACIGGSTWSCGDNGATQTSTECKTTASSSGSSSSPPSSGTSSSSSSSSGGSGSDPSSSNDACEQLATYCSDKCPGPASVNADCVDTANAGDSMKCVLWGTRNSSLCKK